MKRPLFWGTVTFLGVTAAFLCLDLSPAAVALSAGAVVLAWVCSRGGVRALLTFAFCGAAAFGSLGLHLLVSDRLLAPFYGQEIHGGMVVEGATTSGSGHFMEGTALLEAPDGTRITRRIRLAEWGTETAQPGDALSFAAVCEEREDGFVSLSGDLFLRLVREEDGVSPPAFSARLARLRQSAAAAAQKYLPGEEGYVLTALLTGLRYMIPDSLNSAFRAAGMSHLLVVSGLHLSLASGAAGAIPALRRRKRLGACVSCALVWLLALFTGLGVSAVRAAILVTMTLAAAMLSRIGDGLTSLGTAALVITLASPAAIVSASFLLSFSAVCGLMCLSPVLTRALLPQGKAASPLCRRICGALSSSLAAQIGTLPVLAGMFGTFSVSGIAANIIAIPLLLPILLLGAGVAVLFPLRRLLAAPCALLIRLLCAIARLAAEAPLARCGVSETWQLLFIAGAYAAIIAMLIRRPSGKILRLSMLTLLLTLSLGCLADTVGAEACVTLTVPESDDCTVLTRGSRAVLLGVPTDTDGAEDLCDLLWRQNITGIECIFSDSRALGAGTAVLTDAFDTGAIIAPDTNANRAFCRTLGVPLAALGADALLLDALTAAEKKSALPKADGTFIYEGAGIYVVMSERVRALPDISGTVLRLRFAL